ncbi:MAG: hypothetical protein ACREUD_03440 [Gammaproteobacteria bacterium]
MMANAEVISLRSLSGVPTDAHPGIPVLGELQQKSTAKISVITEGIGKN